MELEDQNDNLISPLLDISFLRASQSVTDDDINEQLEDAVTTEDYMDVLNNLHKSQVRKALRSKKRTEEEKKEEVKEEPKVEEPVVEEKPATTDISDDFKPFEPFALEGDNSASNQPASDNSSEEDIFGNFFNNSNGFGGISSDMLTGENKLEVAEALSAEEFRANNNVIDPNNQYINKDDYYKGKEFSKENNKKKNTYLTEEDGLFDPDNVDSSQVVQSSTYATEEPKNKSPFEQTIMQDAPKYVVNEKKERSSTYSETSGRFVAWMAYILFFIPLIFAGKKEFVRHHANQGLVINIVDLIAGALIGAKYLPMVAGNELFETITVITFGVGLGIATVFVVVRVFMVVMCLFGMRPRLPWLGRVDIIKPF